MKRVTNYLAIAALVLTTFASCGKETDLYEGPKPSVNPATNEDLTANTFDFKTTQEINLTVDFSMAGAQGAVYFDVYTENPVISSQENDVTTLLRNEAIKPVYGGYTKSNGIFNAKVTLPAYAQHLYIISSNMLLDTNLLEADVQGGQVTARATTTTKGVTRAAITRASATNEVPVNLYSWAYSGNAASSQNAQQANYQNITTGHGGWYTPLGTWDSQSGRPNYLLNRNDPANSSLVFSGDELQGLFELIGNAVAIDRSCPEEFRTPGDLTLQRNSEVAINMLGGTTMWHSSLGYYYYQGTKPTDLASTPIIMLFPNTQDGHGSGKNSPLVGVERGDAVKLVYYPNIQNGDLSGATTEFPAGTSIGFVLKANGWAAHIAKTTGQTNGFHPAVLNWWCTSTDGLSYCPDGVESGNSKLGQTASRTAKFAFTSGGDEFAVISFEDMNHDTNFADVAFALKPASAFQPLPQIVNKTTDESGVYAFEDLWPSKGDYDMNDVLVAYKYSREFQKYKGQSDSEYKTIRESFSFTTYQNYARLHSGLAFTFQLAATPTNTVFKKRTKGSNTYQDANFTVEDGKVIILTDDINAEIGTEYLVEVTYEQGITGRSTIKPFIFRNTEGGKRLEVHVPFEAPTDKVDMSLFHTEDDLSVPANGIYYVRAGNYPFAFYLAGGDIESFQGSLLKTDNERKPIDQIYPGFLDWSTSNGVNSPDWYR